MVCDRLFLSVRRTLLENRISSKIKDMFAESSIRLASRKFKDLIRCLIN